MTRAKIYDVGDERVWVQGEGEKGLFHSNRLVDNPVGVTAHSARPLHKLGSWGVQLNGHTDKDGPTLDLERESIQHRTRRQAGEAVSEGLTPFSAPRREPAPLTDCITGPGARGKTISSGASYIHLVVNFHTT